jgi:hypothetical protein
MDGAAVVIDSNIALQSVPVCREVQERGSFVQDTLWSDRPHQVEGDDENGSVETTNRTGHLRRDPMRQDSAKKKASSRALSDKTAVRDPVLLERIAEKAYELFQKRGSVHGHDLEDWLEAERRVMVERNAKVGSSNH